MTNTIIASRRSKKTINVALKIDTVAENITEYTLLFTVKKFKDYSSTDDAALLSKTAIKANLAGGIWEIPLTVNDTDFRPGNYYWDIRIIKSDGTLDNVVEGGDFILKPIVTGRNS